MNHSFEDTIVALSTPPGVGAIAVIRVSGAHAIKIVQAIFKGKNLGNQATHTLHFGHITDNNLVIDEVVVALFKAPQSFTKENVVEISCHGSPYVAEKIIQLLIKNGARYARPGEFTQRAFLNGRFDLAQAEAVADLISADNEATHRTAIQQLRGGISQKIKLMREQLIHFASLIELELDFAEEDVEFANREDLKQLVRTILTDLRPLAESFYLGNALKNGIPTVIAGKPNAGKSTLLNALLNEEKAIVSNIPGTTRDVIEDTLNIKGITFRFIDTAGLRETTDVLESIGIEKTKQKLNEAALVLYVFDASDSTYTELMETVQYLESIQKKFLLIANKTDIKAYHKQEIPYRVIPISAAQKTGMEALKNEIYYLFASNTRENSNTTVTNIRHYESLKNTIETLENVLNGLDSGTTGDFIAQDIRLSLYHLGLITGEITHEHLLDNIFSKFCIGK